MGNVSYREMLAGSVRQVNYHSLFASVAGSAEDFAAVFELMFDRDERTAWHAAWICEKVSERSPWLFTGLHLARIVELAVATPLTSVQRLSLSMVLNLGLPEEVPVDFINCCFERMVSLKSPVAVQALSMKVLYEFTRREPDFRAELQATLKAVDAEYYTVGYRSARRNILKRLNAVARYS